MVAYFSPLILLSVPDHHPECITDYQCGPGEVCAGKPGNRKCIIPPEI
jgi:hypothetical protein